MKVVEQGMDITVTGRLLRTVGGVRGGGMGVVFNGIRQRLLSNEIGK